ncbi:TetR/AcrR family transcriptional regulator [Pedomonas mirosovicensis]|uniref:TetR/AcrR family transcriptional regulator n=1 Tax=Pedomonas mirosovicensis TaxID=2908641 RepID=UPI002168C2DD|nr:TetR/AcrR family transcriptional regulator [Pedomonas mirosovicensis]MCH8684509.1 TetR/AcrR family transcriptional regulator [Pedomonas mirosovicensis]
MARTQAPDYDDRRQAIADRAAELFARMGFHRASISDLAEACGTSKSALYHYYSSKEAILFDILRDHTELLLETAEETAGAEGDARERLRRLAERFMEIYVDATSKHVVLLNEIGSLPEEQRREVITLQNKVVDIFLSLLVEIRPELETRTALRKPVAMMFMGALNWTYTWFRAEGPITPSQFADLVVDLFIHGLPALPLPEAKR